MRTLCSPHTSHTLKKALNYAKSWLRKLQELTPQNEPGIKLKMTATSGVKLRRSWLKSLDEAGGGDSKMSTHEKELERIRGPETVDTPYLAQLYQILEKQRK